MRTTETTSTDPVTFTTLAEEAPTKGSSLATEAEFQTENPLLILSTEEKKGKDGKYWMDEELGLGRRARFLFCDA